MLINPSYPAARPSVTESEYHTGTLTPHRLSLPSIFLANVRSLPNKMDELRLRITTHKRIMDCNVMIFTETWLNSGVPDSAIELTGRYILRADRTAEDSAKTRGGGLCIYVNNAR